MSYMEKLLDGAEVEWKALGDVINFQRGKRLVRSQLEESGAYAVYQNSMTPLGYYHESNVHAKSAFIVAYLSRYFKAFLKNSVFLPTQVGKSGPAAADLAALWVARS